MVLKNLVENTSSSNGSNGFNTSSYGRYPDRAYGLLQCRADTTVDQCVRCSHEANTSMLNDCRNASSGRSMFQKCFVRYENYSFFNPFFNPSPAPPPSPTIQPLSPPPHKNSPSKIGMVAGIAGGLFIMLLLCIFAIQRKFKLALLWKPLLLRKGNLDSELDSEIRQEREMIFTLQNIKAATSNFHEDNKLGEGGFGSVYKGTMPNGMKIAVKRLSIQSSQGMKQFLNEVKLVAKIQHCNLVNLLGYCVEGLEYLLVYEFLPNKSLDKILFHPEQSKELDWPKCLNIIFGVACGLLYLHQDSQLQIIHRDIKASNILLKNKMLPKISDFGLARLFDSEETRVSTMIVGTLGYMAPEYAMHRQLSIKADVYSFGVVTLEIICGRKNNDRKLSTEFQSLLEWVWRYYREGDITKIIDKSILNSCPNEQVSRCIHVGLLCTQADPLRWPPMVNVYAMLLNASIANLPNPTKLAYLNITQDNVPGHASTSTPTSTSSSSMSTSHLACASINDASITDLGPR